MLQKVHKREFEEAQNIKEQIAKIELYTGDKISPVAYEQNPNLLSDIKVKELKDLASLININSFLHRIECYDISGIQGKMATGSLVVFTDGFEDKKEYRRFKIRTKNTPDDLVMLKEVLDRRFNHQNWPSPDLLVIDGGQGQLSTAQDILNNLNLNIPVISLAKKMEIICLPGHKSLELPKNTLGLQLLMRIRDEAHRFAKSYHLLLRSKDFLPAYKLKK